MACVSLPELHDRQLLAYLDGEDAGDVAGHLALCPHCRERASRLAALQDRLAGFVHRSTCPDPMELGEYHLELLPPDLARAVARHLADCPHCSREIAQLGNYMGVLVRDLEFSPVERVKVWVAQLVRSTKEMGQPGMPTLALAYAGLRGEEEGPRIYQAGDVQVALEVRQDAEQPEYKMLLGLVTGVEVRDWKAHLWLAGERTAQTSVDELGNWILPNLASGSYELILSGPEIEVHILEVDVG